MKRELLLILCLILFLHLPECSTVAYCQQSKQQTAQSADIEKKRGQIKALEEEIALINKQISTAGKKEKNTLNRLALIRKKVSARKNLLSQLERELNTQNAELARHEASLKQMETNLNNLSKEYKHLVVTAFKNRDTRKWFLYLFASKNIEQGYRRWIYLKNYCDAINDQGQKVVALKGKTEAARKKVMEMRAVTQQKQRTRTAELEQFQRDEKENSALAGRLAKEQKALKRDLKSKQSQAANLNRQIERMLAAAIKQSNKETGKNQALKEQDIKLSNEFGANKGRLPWPVSNGVVVEEFGQHPHPVLKGVMLPFNNGVNISAAQSAAVKSVFDGTVKQIIIIPGYSHCVLVQHGSYFTFYCKLGRVNVKVGQKLSMGSIIGALEENILHFELWMGTTKQNPTLWLR